MDLDEAARLRLDTLITASDVTLFMKGTRQQPQCGFSSTVIQILDTLIPDYQTVDVLADQQLRENIKVYSSWPTIPQLYVKGEFVGGCDIIQELFQSGELAGALGIELPSIEDVSITISDRAAEQLRSAAEQQGGSGRDLHLSIDARFEAKLFIGPTGDGELAIEANGITLRMDRVSASRANGISLDVVVTPQGSGFKIENPNSPKIAQMSVGELKALLDSGDDYELMDVRTLAERETAHIEGSILMDDAQAARLEALPKNTKLVFHCHHGPRSQQAAEHFAALGFTNLHNVVGGIDAWSTEIDPDVPTY